MRATRLGSMLVALAAAATLAGVATGDGATTATRGVSAAGLSFTPPSVTVGVGDTVRWTNDGGQHNVVFDDGSYRSGDPTLGTAIGQRTFPAAGTFTYHCELHQDLGMTGTIVVTAGPVASPTPTASPSPSGSPTPTASPSPSGSPTPTASPSPSPSAAPTPTATSGPVTVPGAAPALSRVRLAARVRGGRLRGSARVAPAGARLTVAVQRAGAPVGSVRRRVRRAGTLRFAVRLARPVRRALARGARPGVRVLLLVASGESTTSATRSVRLRG